MQFYHVCCAVDLQVSSRDNCHGVDETIASLIRFVPTLELRDNNEMRGRVGAIGLIGLDVFFPPRVMSGVIPQTDIHHVKIESLLPLRVRRARRRLQHPLLTISLL